jgi:hypothetical protein
VSGMVENGCFTLVSKTMLFPLVLLLSIQTVVGVRWDKMGPTGPYVHKKGPNAAGEDAPIAQPYHASLKTSALATVRELWEVSTAFPFYWFPVEYDEVVGAIDTNHFGGAFPGGTGHPDVVVQHFCLLWMHGGTKLVLDGRELGPSSAAEGKGVCEDASSTPPPLPPLPPTDAAPPAAAAAAPAKAEPDFGVVDWMCHTYMLRGPDGFGRLSETLPKSREQFTRGQKAASAALKAKNDHAEEEENRLLNMLRATLCALRGATLPATVYFHPHITKAPEKVKALVRCVSIAPSRGRQNLVRAFHCSSPCAEESMTSTRIAAPR